MGKFQPSSEYITEQVSLLDLALMTTTEKQPTYAGPPVRSVVISHRYPKSLGRVRRGQAA